MPPNTFRMVWDTTRWLLILVAVTPLLYMGGVYYPFVVPKVIYFRTLVELAVVAIAIYAVGARENLNLAIFKKKIVWLPLVFLAFSYLSAIFGLDFYHSLWSIFERMDGLVTLTHLIVYFYLVLVVFTKEDWRKFFIANGAVAILVALYALGQYFGISWFEDLEDSRVKGTIGNAAFLASYLGIMFFVALYLAHETASRFARIGWRFAGALSLVTILMTQTRGTIVAGAVSLLVFFVWWSLSATEKRYKVYAISGMCALAAVGILGYEYRTSLSHSSIPVVARVASISLNDPTTMSRLFIWKNSLAAFTERPILGYGMENFEYVYNRFYDPQIVAEEWFDRSHNVYIDQLIHGGVIGFLLYLFILLYAFYATWQYARRERFAGMLFFFLLLTYAIQNFFVFDTLNSAFLFWAIFAYLIFLTAEPIKSKGIPWKRESSKGCPWMVVVFIVVAASMGGVWYFVNYLPLRANMALGEGYKYQIVDVKRSLGAFERGLLYRTFADMEYGYQTYDTYTNKVGYGKKMTRDEMEKSYEAAIALYKELLEKYPWNVRLYVYFGHIIENRPEGIVYDEALFEELMKKATELSPKRPTAYYIWANIYLSKLKYARTEVEKQEIYEKALEVLSLYATRVPGLPDAQFVVAGVAEKAGKKDMAEEYFKNGERVYTSSPALARRAVGYLLRLNDYARAERYLKDIAEGERENPNAWFDLAKVYYLNGKVDEAVEALNTVNALNPEVIKKDPALANEILNSYR